ncbi:MAG: Spy0128 family protein, partial [Aristaeellaceae bacterium]
MTKKFFAILLALVLAFAMSTVAFASGDVQGSTEDTASATHDPNQNGTPVLIKVYGAEGTTANSPAETFTFTVAAKNSYVIGNPEATYPTVMPSVADAVYGVGDAGSTDNKTKTLAITLPTYSRVGVYEYTITETPSTNAGVETLGTRTLTLVVNVTLKDDGSNETKAYVHAETTGGNKTNSFSDNKYSAGTLTVTKEVTGNMGDTQKEFDVTVEFTAPAGKTVNSTITY